MEGGYSSVENGSIVFYSGLGLFGILDWIAVTPGINEDVLFLRDGILSDWMLIGIWNGSLVMVVLGDDVE